MEEDGNERQTECHRCGTCCMKGGPALHGEDLPLLTEGIIDTSHVYTLREGEIVRNTDDRLMRLEQEIIKIKGDGQNTWACLFYDSHAQACRIYTRRPVECRSLQCWDPGPLYEAMKLPYIRRTRLLEPEDEIRKIITAHEARCAYSSMEKAVQALGGDTPDRAVHRILDMLHYDHVVRTVVPEKLNIAPDMLDFLFGRPMCETIQMYGFQVLREGDGFRLVPLKQSPEKSST